MLQFQLFRRKTKQQRRILFSSFSSPIKGKGPGCKLQTTVLVSQHFGRRALKIIQSLQRVSAEKINSLWKAALFSLRTLPSTYTERFWGLSGWDCEKTATLLSVGFVVLLPLSVKKIVINKNGNSFCSSQTLYMRHMHSRKFRVMRTFSQ